MSFADRVAAVRACPGVVAAAIADSDGIPVESWGPSQDEVEEIVAEFSTFLREVVAANRELQLGELEQVVVVGDRRVIQVTAITRDYFLMTVVERDGNAGKARFASRLAAFQLRHEFE